MEKIVAKLVKSLSYTHQAWREEMMEDLTLKLKCGYKLYEMREWDFLEQKRPVTPFMMYDRDVYFFAKPEGKDFADNDILITDFGERIAHSHYGRILPLSLDDPLW